MKTIFTCINIYKFLKKQDDSEALSQQAHFYLFNWLLS